MLLVSKHKNIHIKAQPHPLYFSLVARSSVALPPPVFLSITMDQPRVYTNEKDDSSLEKGSSAYGPGKQEGEDRLHGAEYAVAADERHQFDARDLDQVQRKLQQRHVQMIAIAGTIGTGLFLGSGEALSTGGPLGALIAYALVGTVAFAVSLIQIKFSFLD